MCFITSLNKVYCWGRNLDGECGRGDTVDPVLLSEATEAPADPKDVVCSDGHTLVSTDTGPPFLWCGGRNMNAECSGDTTVITPWVTWGVVALPAVGITRILDLTAMWGVSGAVVEINGGVDRNRAYVWGIYIDWATHGLSTGLGSTFVSASWVLEPDGAPQPVQYRLISNTVTAITTEDGRLSMQCTGDEGACGYGPFGSDIFTRYVPTFSRVMHVSGQNSVVCAQQEDGNPLCWGENTDGETGSLPSRTDAPHRLGYSFNIGM